MPHRGQFLAIGDQRVILLRNHGVVCFHKDLEYAYYQLEIVDAYARILLLTKQLGNVNTLKGDEMAELLKLKERFGFTDPRMEDAKRGAVSCARCCRNLRAVV